MARRPKNPINDIINTTSAWLGGNRGTMPSQTRKGIDAIKGVGKVLDSATGGFGQAVVSDAQSGSNTPSALYKTAAVNLAAAATGVGAARVAGKAVQSGRVVNPVAAARNTISGQRVVLHGSPQSGLSTLRPTTGSKTLPDQNVLFSWNPRRANMSNEIHLKAVRYANKQENPGSIYVVKVPKKATGPHPKRTVTDSKNMLVTRGEGKIVAEVPMKKQFSELSQVERKQIASQVQTELRKAGVQPRGMPRVLDQALTKVDDALWKAEFKTKQTVKKIRKSTMSPKQLSKYEAKQKAQRISRVR